MHSESIPLFDDTTRHDYRSLKDRGVQEYNTFLSQVTITTWLYFKCIHDKKKILKNISLVDV
jgi:hypothetical protein